jgi:hypothetical protein
MDLTSCACGLRWSIGSLRGCVRGVWRAGWAGLRHAGEPVTPRALRRAGALERADGVDGGIGSVRHVGTGRAVRVIGLACALYEWDMGGKEG